MSIEDRISMLRHRRGQACERLVRYSRDVDASLVELTEETIDRLDEAIMDLIEEDIAELVEAMQEELWADTQPEPEYLPEAFSPQDSRREYLTCRCDVCGYDPVWNTSGSKEMVRCVLLGPEDMGPVMAFCKECYEKQCK